MTAFSERVGEQIKCSVTGETYYYYVPRPLPPIPAIEMEKLYSLLDHANKAINLVSFFFGQMLVVHYGNSCQSGHSTTTFGHYLDIN